MDVVVAHVDAHGIRGNRHALDHNVGVVVQDVAVLAGARFALVRVAHQVLLTRELARHEAPLQAGGKTCTATAAQAGLFDGGNHLVLRQGFAAIHAQDLAQRLVAAARDVVLQVPVVAIQPRINLRIDVATMEAGLDPTGLELREDLLNVHACPSALRKPSIS